jgi:hypothetical protein
MTLDWQILTNDGRARSWPQGQRKRAMTGRSPR